MLAGSPPAHQLCRYFPTGRLHLASPRTGILMMSRVSVAFLCAFCLVAMAADGPAPVTPASPDVRPHIIMGPYVNGVDASSARIVWVSQAGIPPVRVRVDGGDRHFEAVSVPSRIAGRDEVLHTATLSGLAAFTRYAYHIGSEEVPPGGAFVTAPNGKAPFKFVVYGDARTNSDLHRTVSRAIASEDPAFVVCTGDLVTDGDVWDQWKPEFFAPARAYLERATLWPVRGNHDGDGRFYCSLFDLPGKKLYYSFDFGNAHFVVLDTELNDKGHAMRDWLKQDLASSHAEWTFVFYHIPTFNVGGHTSTWGRRDYLPVLESGGVDFVIAGHSHLYERFVPIGPSGRKPIIHIVSAGGGAPLYEVRPSPILTGGIGTAELHYCVFEIDGSRCDMTARRPDRSVLDRLSLVKKDGAYQDEVMATAVPTEKAEKMEFMFVHPKVEFASIPGPGRKVRVSIIADRFPDGCSVTVRQAKDEKAWQVEPQKVTAQDGGFPFEVRAPATFRASPKGFTPGLRLALTVEDGGRTYAADNVEVGISDDTLRKAVAAPVPVPIPYSTVKVTVDGDLSEWAGAVPMPRPFDKQQTSSFRFGWREEGLYGAVAAKDNSIKVDPAAPWAADGVDLFIEKDFARSIGRSANSAEYAFSPAPESGPGAGHVVVAYDRDRSRSVAITCAWRPTAGGRCLSCSSSILSTRGSTSSCRTWPRSAGAATASGPARPSSTRRMAPTCPGAGSGTARPTSRSSRITRGWPSWCRARRRTPPACSGRRCTPRIR